MQSSTSSENYGLGLLFIILFGFGAGFTASWVLDTFNLGMEIAGVTKYAIVYYLACMVISTGVFLTSSSARKVGIFLALYPFGLFSIFSSGFTSSFEPNPVLGGGLVMGQAFMVQIFVWVIPAVVTGYFLLKAWQGRTKEGAGDGQ